MGSGTSKNKVPVQPAPSAQKEQAAATQPASGGAQGLGQPRPRTAKGTFLRILTVNDVYKLDNYPNLASAIIAAKAEAKKLDCVVVSTLNGDFLGPCVLTALDAGRGMTEALNQTGFDYVGIGNHELDYGFDFLAKRVSAFEGKCINSNISNPELKELPRFDVVTVGARSVVVAGLLTADTSIYAPSNVPTMIPLAEAAEAVWEEAKAKLGKTPELFLPMTHCLVPEDKELAVSLSKHAEIGSRVPVLLGGHEHDLFIDEAGNSTIVKVGQDAERVGIVDVWWTEEGQMRHSVQYVPCGEFAKEPKCQEFVAGKKQFLEAIMTAPIANTPEDMTSKTVRFEPSGVATFLLTLLRRSVETQGVDLAMVQGGFVRANREYKAEADFLMGDLFSEFAFEGPQAIIPIKGSIIQESCAATREMPKPAPNFLHFDSGVEIGDDHNIKSIGGAPFDPEKIYSVVIYHHLLTGLNIIEPLYSYVQQNVTVPDIESCRPVKDLVLELCMKDIWRRLFGFNGMDKGQHVSQDELMAGIESAVREMDSDGDGRVGKRELEQYMKAHEDGHTALVERLLATLDVDGDGYICKEEFKSLAF